MTLLTARIRPARSIWRIKLTFHQTLLLTCLHSCEMPHYELTCVDCQRLHDRFVIDLHGHIPCRNTITEHQFRLTTCNDFQHRYVDLNIKTENKYVLLGRFIVLQSLKR